VCVFCVFCGCVCACLGTLQLNFRACLFVFSVLESSLPSMSYSSNGIYGKNDV